MSVVAPSRRLAQSCLFAPPQPTRLLHLSLRQGRHASSDPPSARSNPVLEEFRRKNPAGSTPSSPGLTEAPATGDLAASSIFEADRRARKQAESAPLEQLVEQEEPSSDSVRDPRAMDRIIDPNAGSRERWERRKVIQDVRRGGRLRRATFLTRTERQHTAKSANLKTSTKKLGMLARQIAGKTLEDACVQMRFSGKKIAGDVLRHLEYARDQAVVMRGMGLGRAVVGASAARAEKAGRTARPGALLAPPSTTTPPISSTTAPPTSSIPAPPTSFTTTTPTPSTPTQAQTPTTIEIQLKSSARHRVPDPSALYIDQAWVGRGPYGRLAEYRAQGRVNVMRPPHTSLTVVLKEERTRVREWEEREAKRRRGRETKVWVAMPDRVVVGQSQVWKW